ncbi:MAG: Mut7-C RNAse domain-containing protein, partial [Spirochaetes bacterium]|nr:Mut7-C RNAse domain-containing protein [Spirochaetota bacterium]
GLLKRKAVERGYWLRSTDPIQQLKEVIKRFQLNQQMKLLSICLKCNGPIVKVDKKSIHQEVDADIYETYHNFYQCSQCQKIYWNGLHIQKMFEILY